MRFFLIIYFLGCISALDAQSSVQTDTRLAVRAYVDTSRNGAILRSLYKKGGIELDPADVADGHVFAESSWGLKRLNVKKKTTNIGDMQNLHSNVMAREMAKFIGPVDSIHTGVDSATVADSLLNNRDYDYYHGTLTMIEMTRHHYNMGRRGGSLLRASIRSYASGKKRKKYMMPSLAVYRDKVLNIARGK